MQRPDSSDNIYKNQNPIVNTTDECRVYYGGNEFAAEDVNGMWHVNTKGNEYNCQVVKSKPKRLKKYTDLSFEKLSLHKDYCNLMITYVCVHCPMASASDIDDLVIKLHGLADVIKRYSNDSYYFNEIQLDGTIELGTPLKPIK